MRWFTAENRYTDDEAAWKKRVAEYERHLEDLTPRLSDGAEQLPGINVHDGQVQLWEYEAGERLRLVLLIGDLQRGYENLTLEYMDADAVGSGDADLATRKLTEPGVEILYDEIDRAGDGRFEHRLLFWPNGELTIRFGSLHVSSDPAAADQRR
jgi:hypothetical protein